VVLVEVEQILGGEAPVHAPTRYRPAHVRFVDRMTVVELAREGLRALKRCDSYDKTHFAFSTRLAEGTMSTVGKAGLEDVVVSTSEVCFIDGREGRLLYRGYDVDELVAKSTFEEVAFLLWHGHLPSKKELADHTKALTAGRKISPKVVAILKLLPKKTTPMEVLRTGVSALSSFDPDAADNSREASIRKAIRLTAQMPTLVAAWERIRRGKPVVAPNVRMNLAANFLYMMTGKKPTDLAAKTFDVALILHADHEFNASTFAARVTAATLSDMHSSVVSGIGALKGPLHGGANEQVMLMVENSYHVFKEKYQNQSCY
jgi:citrate synthase